MSLTATAGGDTPKKQLPTGLHPAILIWIIDIGQQETPWGWKPRVMFTFELPKQVIEIEGEGFKPMVHSEEISPFIWETSNLGKFLQGWFGKLPKEAFDLKKLLGKPCMLNIIHKDNGYPKINSISPPTAEAKNFQPTNDLLVYELGSGEPIPEKLPDWIKLKIMNSREWNERGQMPLNDYPNKISDETNPEDIPF